ncbi:MAG: diguanylate cyclase [Opitutae bacterium]|nr:diguanylate cyclase [Opitutae bacterium]
MARLPRLLLIDDDRLQHRIVQQMVKHFRGAPLELESAETYAAGLKKLLGGQYAVCLLDYRLGERDGLALLREAQAARCETPVIFLTAETSEEVDVAALEAGASDYLVKNEITPRLLERAIRYALKLGLTLSQLRQLATHDELTGIINRREFQRVLDEEWRRAQRFQHPFALVIADLDHFKLINDTHGHQVGDEVLWHVASLLAGQVRTVDRVARHGGEEFALLMVETDRKQAVEALKRLYALLAETPCVIAEKNLTIPVTLSAGVAAMPSDAGSPAELLAKADKALYAAKKAGRNRIVTADGKVVRPVVET